MHTIYKNTNRPPNKLNNIKSIKYRLVKETKEQNQKKKKKKERKMVSDGQYFNLNAKIKFHSFVYEKTACNHWCNFNVSNT